MNKESLEVSYHAIERFKERALGIEPTDDFIPKNECLHISSMIEEDIAENHAYIKELGTGKCYSATYNLIYQVENFVVVTVKCIETQDFPEKAGGRLRNKCKQSKNIRKKFHSERKYGKAKDYSGLN